ncbi:lysophospholipid acyltransferase family protein [candidate division KSB1 bacterium]|nr:lysophospholipid acyltransferase family protein [candidate division KSB1 bacterium]
MNKKRKQEILFYVATKFGWLLILLLGKLCSIKTIGHHYWRELVSQKKTIIFVIWHGRILLPIYAHRNQGISPIISLHADGEMISQTVERLGYKPIRGSSTRGGNKAFHESVVMLKNGGTSAIMPDGPKGPRHRFKPGTLYLAQKTDGYLIPLTFCCKRKIEFKSWDRFNLITPFSKAILIYGKPVHVPSDISKNELEYLRIKIEADMIAYEKQADEYFRT